ncbi:toll-like receptor 2 [Magallana gigas]|uniref:toll-like receptor 2 n=1 Tax=Magallana gigas TaxID=29159 RepID=UPI00333FD3FB
MGWNKTKCMMVRQLFVSIVLMCRVTAMLTQNCSISYNVDDCGNKGLLWNCSGSNISKMPTVLPPELENSNTALDISYNQFTSLTKDTFEAIAAYSKVTSVILHHNNITKISKMVFQKMSILCSLDISNVHLKVNDINAEAFSNLNELQFLQIHQNDFHKAKNPRYPGIQLSKLRSLKYLKIDIFNGFQFQKPFENLSKLSKLEFNTIGEFKIANTSFEGLKLSPLRSLDMKFRNHVDCDVSEDLFCSFPYLDTNIEINFGGKCSIYAALRSLKCLQYRVIQKIDISANVQVFESDIVNISDKSFKYLFNICVSELILDYDAIIYLHLHLYRTTFWTCLNKLSLRSNRIQYVSMETIFALLTLPRLLEINACCNSRPPDTELFNIHSQQRYQNITININLPKSLIVLDYSYNYIHNQHYIRWYLLVTLIGENLRILNLQKTNFPLQFEHIFNFPSLRILNLSENNFTNIHPNIFQRVRNLRQLSAANVHLDLTNILIAEGLFKNLKCLTKLDLSRNGLAFLPQSLLRDQKQSLTEINLDHNMFSSIYDSLIQLENLNNLYLRYNLISKISEKDQRHFESLKNLSIYIGGNPISCACLNIQSLKWMKDHQNSFPDLGNVLCLENNHHVGHLFNDEIWRTFELDCQSKDWLIFSTVLLFLTILAFTSIVAIKNYRVHLEYVILRLKKQWKGIPLRKSEEEFLFDVYVSYSESDYVWVRDKLCPNLEDLNVKSWITDMNSTPGRWVLEGIVNRINECRKVMFVVSESFLDMEWSSYAVKTAITHAFHNQRQGFIVVLIKDGVALEKLPDELKNIWWCIEHFRWPEEESNEVILKKLTKALKSDLTF